MRWLAKSPEETEAFGRRLALSRPAGNSFATIYLSGDLGTGKTTLARGFLRASGINGPIRSPTYTLMEVYEAPAIFILHLDLYRLTDPDELEPLGLREWARAGHLWLVEWPDRGAGRLPLPDLSLTLTAGADAHEINLEAFSALGNTWLAGNQSP